MNNLPVMEIIMPQQPTGNVPAFLAKLWKMVDNPETDQLIGWSEEGTSFLIRNQADFTREMLPYYYKHSNMASFVRQLNMYGFHKVLSVDSGGLKGDRDETEFAHPYFMRGQEHLLDQIKRKVSVAAARPGPGVFLPSIKSEKVNEVLSEVSLIKDRQEDLDGKLDTMKNENEALWREVLSLRQKHTQQQKIVNKLIQFLVALVQPRMGGAMKRRYPTVPGQQLAIEEGGPGGKEPRMEEEAGPVIQELGDQEFHEFNEALLPGPEEAGRRPQEVEAGRRPLEVGAGRRKAPEVEELSEMTGPQLQEFLNISQEATVTSPTVEKSQSLKRSLLSTPPYKQEPKQEDSSGPSQAKYRLVDPASVNPALVQQQQMVKSENKRPVLHREISKEDFDLDINSMQKELDNLKEILSGQITLDTSLVSSLFNVDHDGLPNMNLFNESLLNREEEASVLTSSPAENQPNSVVSYNPSLFELTEDDDTPYSDSLMPPPAEGGANKAMSITVQPGTAFDLELNTPNISEDSSDPLLKLLYKFKKQ